MAQSQAQHTLRGNRRNLAGSTVLLWLTLTNGPVFVGSFGYGPYRLSPCLCINLRLQQLHYIALASMKKNLATVWLKNAV